MIAEIKLYTNKKLKKGYPVVFYFRNKNIRKRVSLNWFFEKDEWNFELQQPIPAAPNYDFVYPKLLNYKYQIKQLLFNGVENIESYLNVLNKSKANEIEELKKRLKQLQEENKVGILEFFEVFIQEKKQKKQSTHFYESAKKQLHEFLGEDQPLNSITYEWINRFILYKEGQGTGKPGIMGYLGVIRSVYKEAQKRATLNVKQDNPFIGVMKFSKNDKLIEVTPADFLKIKTFDIENTLRPTKMEIFVNLWFFQFIIGGHDLIDVANLRWENYINGRLQFKRYKNRNKPSGGTLVSNKVFPFAKWFIEKYGDKNNNRMFPFIQDFENMDNYNVFRGLYNRYLKRISVQQKLSTKISSKTTRYVFRTYAGELLINDLIVMQIQGHKPTGVSFNYQKRLPNAIIDQHHQLIIDNAEIFKKV